MLYGNVVSQSHVLHVGIRYRIGIVGYIAGVNVVLKGSFVVGVFLYFSPKVGIKVRPLFEGVFGAPCACCHTSGNQSRFDGKGARSTHRVYKVALPLPTGFE